MTEEYTPQPDPAAADAAPAADSAGDAWRDLVRQLDELGEAVGRWARATANDPSYREKAAELKSHVDKIATSVVAAVDDATDSDVGQQFAEAATKTGEAFKAAGERVTEEVAPRLASVFGKAADKLHQAASRIETEAAPMPGDDGDATEDDA